MNIPECVEFIQTYDIVLFGETKIDDTDISEVTNCLKDLGYQVFFKNRFKHTVRKSGGLAAAIKLSIVKHARVVTKPSKAVQWLILDKKLLGLDQDILLGNIYIPPEGTRYTKPEYFIEIENELAQLCESRYVCLCGDMNGYTGTLADFLDDERAVRDDNELYSFEDGIDSTYFDEVDIPMYRITSDKHRPNNYGHRVINLCKACNLLILNGRVGKDKLIGKCTCNDISVVDYVLTDKFLTTLISEFEISDFDPLLSDVHSPVVFVLQNKIDIDQNQLLYEDRNESLNKDQNESVRELDSNEQFYRWLPDRKDLFVQSIDRDKVQHLLQELENVDDVNVINEVTETIGNIMTETAASVFGKRKVKKHQNRKHKPWFDKECCEKRKTYTCSKRLYKRFRTVQNRDCIRQAGKNYKNYNYHKQFAKKLQNLRSTDPKQYWNLLRKNKKKNEVKVSLQDLLTHFKDLGGERDGDDNDEMILPEDMNDEPINSPVTEQEIREVVKELKIGKSPGIDNIINEYIQSTIDVFATVYVKLFNTVLDSGEIPASWVTGRIIPIYKQNGSTKLAENYRGITLVSCFGKNVYFIN